MTQDSFLSILPLLIGGIVIFLYAIRRLSMTLRDVFSDKAKRHIEKYTSTVLRSILVGIVVTILMDSSSAVIIIAIILINAGTLNFKQVMGIIMGANIGTTFSSQLIAMNISKYAYIVLVLSFFFWMFFRPGKLKKYALITLYFSMLFFGLYMLEVSVSPLKESEVFSNWLKEMSDPLTGAFTGGLVTLIIQSSSATIGMLITLAKQNLIELTAAVAAMLGAELGTCSDTLLAVIGGKKDAIRAGIFHLLFNLIPITLGLLFFDPFIDLINFLFPNATVARQIANAHVAFSVISVLLFLPFVTPFYNLIRHIIPSSVFVETDRLSE